MNIKLVQLNWTEILTMRINPLTYEPSIRIGIVGAGCTGLTAAEELRDLGYKNILAWQNLLEKSGNPVILTL